MEIKDMIVCINCGKIIEKIDNFCRHCGQRMRCEKCGKNSIKMAADHITSFNFCESCGHQSDFEQ